MLKRLFLLPALLLAGAAHAQTPSPPPAAEPTAAADAAPVAAPRVLMRTSLGDITVELAPDKAPKTVENFLAYVQAKFYDGTVFHRVIENFMVQGGGFGPDLVQKPTRAPVQNEADNGLSNLRGTIAMARTMDPNSATAQFFINVVDNQRLDYARTDVGVSWGYTVFGKVVSGMDVVDKIRTTPTGPGGPFPTDVPVTPVVIQSIEVLP